MKQFLTPQERENLKLQHKREHDKRICDRIKAVLLFDNGWEYKQIAHVLLLSDDAVRQHLQDYHDTQKLKPENGGSCSKLNTEQAAFLAQHLQQHTYLYVKDIDILSKRVFVREDKTLNSSSTIAFLQDIETAYPQARKVHMFCDNAKYYRNKDVQVYLRGSKIEMHFLPPYSPNLNPIERLWKFVNEHVLYKVVRCWCTL